jgi:hypothetical protein
MPVAIPRPDPGGPGSDRFRSDHRGSDGIRSDRTRSDRPVPDGRGSDGTRSNRSGSDEPGSNRSGPDERGAHAQRGPSVAHAHADDVRVPPPPVTQSHANGRLAIAHPNLTVAHPNHDGPARAA